MHTSAFVSDCNDPSRTLQSCLTSLREGGAHIWLDREGVSCLRSCKGPCRAWSQKNPGFMLTSVAHCQAPPCFCLDNACTKLDMRGWLEGNELGTKSQCMARAWCSAFPRDRVQSLPMSARGLGFVYHLNTQGSTQTLLFLPRGELFSHSRNPLPV